MRSGCMQSLSANTHDGMLERHLHIREKSQDCRTFSIKKIWNENACLSLPEVRELASNQNQQKSVPGIQKQATQKGQEKMTAHYFQSATAHHFPDMMNTNANHANDNPYRKDKPMAQQTPDPIQAMMNAIDQVNQVNTQLVQIVNKLQQVIADHEHRIIELEEMIDG